MLSCVQIQIKCPSKKIEQQVKKHEADASNKLRKVNIPLKKSVISILNITCITNCFFPINTEKMIQH